MKKLNFGCHHWKIPGFINIDIDPNQNPDMVLDASKELPFEDNSIDEIYAWHFIEHLDMHEIHWTMSEWKRILKEWWKITITVPDIETWLEEYRKWMITLDWYNQIVFWASDRIQQAHHQAFTHDILLKLVSVYFDDVRIVSGSEVWTIQDWWLIVADVAWQTICTWFKK